MDITTKIYLKRKFWRVHIGLFADIFLSFATIVLVGIFTGTGSNDYLVPSILFTYTFLIIFLLKGDIFTKHFKEQLWQEFSNSKANYYGFMFFRLFYLVLSCISAVLAPVMWVMFFITL